MRGRSGWGWGFIPGKTDTNSYPFQEDKHFLSVQTLYKSRSKRSINCLNGLHVGLKKISIHLNSLPISVRKNLVHSFFFIRIYLIRISRLKFAKF